MTRENHNDMISLVYNMLLCIVVLISFNSAIAAINAVTRHNEINKKLDAIIKHENIKLE